MNDLDEGFWQWVTLAVLGVNTIVALTISIRAARIQSQVDALEGKIKVLLQVMLDTGRKRAEDD